MDLKDALDNNGGDMVKFFREEKIIYRKYTRENCYILKMNPENITKKWHRDIRGVVYNYEDKKILVLPPSKSYEISDTQLVGDIFTELYDGTMINVFYNNDKWNLSSRSTIGCNNRWLSKSTYKDLFEKTCQIDYNSLNKEYSYSFVLRNKLNRNISWIENDEVILVKVYDTENECEIELKEEWGFKIPKVHDNLNDIDITDHRVKGITYTVDNKRYKWLTTPFKRANEIKLNINDKSLLYFKLRQNGNLKEYLSYFPEDTEVFAKGREFFHRLKQILYDTYFSVYVKKMINFKEVQYEYKPLIREIHKIYILSGNKIRMSTIENYLHNTPSKRLRFIMNFSE